MHIAFTINLNMKRKERKKNTKINQININLVFENLFTLIILTFNYNPVKLILTKAMFGSWFPNPQKYIQWKSNKGVISMNVC